MAELLKLRILRLSFNQITDVGPLDGLSNLTELGLGDNQISNIELLSGLTNLRTLDLTSNRISDVGPLMGLTNLVRLDLVDNYLRNSNIEPLAALTNLYWLDLTGTSISNIEPLAELGNLRSLWLGNNEIADIGPLAELTNLNYLGLAHNEITNIEPLAGLNNLTSLDLGQNQISNIEPSCGLVNLISLSLWFNQISDIMPLKEIKPNLNSLYLDANPLNCEAYYSVIPQIIENNPTPHHISYDPMPAECEEPPPPPPGLVSGIDVSSTQGLITRTNWDDVFSADYEFTFIRSSWGDWRPPQGRDGRFVDNMKNAADAGLLVGAYHFAYPVENDPEDEAMFFVDVARDYLRKGYLQPALDMENDEDYGSYPLSIPGGAPALAAWIEVWMDKVKELTGGVEAILYVNKSYAEALQPYLSGKCDLWIANWTCDPTTGPNTGGWTDWIFWQHSSPDPEPQGCGHYSIPGFPDGVDLNLFNGDRTALESYVITISPPEDIIQDEIDQLEELLAANPDTTLADNVGDAINYAAAACENLTATPPNSQTGIKNIEKAVEELQQAIDEELLGSEQGDELISPLVDIARQVAVKAINHAIVSQGKAQKIAEAEQELAFGDLLRIAEQYAWAVDTYKDTVVSAQKAL